MELFGVAITFLSFVLAYQIWQNGKWMKEGIGKLGEGINKLGEGINKLDETVKYVAEQNNKLGETVKYITGQNNKLGEGIIEIKNLIVEENRATRELIARMDDRTAKIAEQTNIILQQIGLMPQKTVTLLREGDSEYKIQK